MIAPEIGVYELAHDIVEGSRSTLFSDPKTAQVIEFRKNETGAVAVLTSHRYVNRWTPVVTLSQHTLSHLQGAAQPNGVTQNLNATK